MSTQINTGIPPLLSDLPVAKVSLKSNHLNKSYNHYIPSNKLKPKKKSSRPLRDAPVNNLNSNRVYPLTEVSQHDHPDDLWMVIYNKVYDVTSFAAEHPGGAEVLFDCGGVDATEAFEDVAHSDDALNMLQPYYIGELAKPECIQYRKPITSIKAVEVTKSKKLKNRQIKLIHYKKQLFDQLILCSLVTLAILALVLYVYLQKFKWTSYIDF